METNYDNLLENFTSKLKNSKYKGMDILAGSEFLLEATIDKKSERTLVYFDENKLIIDPELKNTPDFPEGNIVFTSLGDLKKINISICFTDDQLTGYMNALILSIVWDFDIYAKNDMLSHSINLQKMFSFYGIKSKDYFQKYLITIKTHRPMSHIPKKATDIENMPGQATSY